MEYKFLMNLTEIYGAIHNYIAIKERKPKLTQEDMAKRIGCSQETYGSHLRGDNEPASVKQFLCLLKMLDDDDILKVVKQFNGQEPTK